MQILDIVCRPTVSTDGSRCRPTVQGSTDVKTHTNPNRQIRPNSTRQENVKLSATKRDINIGVAGMRPPGQNGPIRTDSRLRHPKWNIAKTIRGAVETYDTLISTLLASERVPAVNQSH